MKLATLRDELAACLRRNVKTPADVEVYARMKAQPHMPCLMITGLDEVEFHVTSMGDDSRWRFMVLGVTPGGLGDEESQRALDVWLSDEAGGVMRAIEQDATFATFVDDVIVRTSDGYGFYVVGGSERLGASWLVDVFT